MRTEAATPPARDRPANDAFWAQDVETLLERLNSSRLGLTSAEASIARERYGANVLAERRETSVAVLLARQFLSPIDIILIAATVLSGVLGDATDAVIILVILVLSGVLGFVQEMRAGNAVRTLLASVEVTVSAWRDGEPTTLPATSILPGDVVRLRAGDVIPGDGLVLESDDLSLDESAMTGETFPSEKRPGVLVAETPLTQRTNSAFLGTHVVSGSGSMLVVHTGRDTEYAAVSARVGSREKATGFERGLTRFGLLLTRVMIALVVVIFIINLLLQRPPVDSALFSLALAVGLTPQLLPAIVAIGLAHGARLMARKRVIVRRLDAIEDFGSMTILCSDKTGTMTVGRIQLGQALAVDGSPDDSVLRLASLNAGLQTSWRNPIDEAIVATMAPPPGARRIAEAPYDFLRKRLGVLVATEDPASELLVVKGAFDPVLTVCTSVLRDGAVTELDARTRADLARLFERLSGEGLRVLGVATRPMPGSADVSAADEHDLTFAGLLTFADPAKPDAADTLRELESNGVSVRMLTGDNRHVAAHVARQVGLRIESALTGTDVDRMDDRALRVATRTTEVFSELNPIQKERILRAYHHEGHVVGYLGDGINDAPSLHAADVGITVDSAVPVARQSAAIVLLDKDLGVLLQGVHAGRRTFSNTMKYIFVNTSASFGNMISMVVGAAVLPFLPLLASQVLLVNLLSDLPAMSLAADSVDEQQLRRPQTWNVPLIRTYMIVFGLVSSLFDLTSFAVLIWGYQAEATEFRSAWFVCSILTEVGVLIILRTRGAFWRSRPSTVLLVLSAAVAAVTIALPFLPFASALDLAPLPLSLLAIVLAITLTYLGVTELVKRAFWKRQQRTLDTADTAAR